MAVKVFIADSDRKAAEEIRSLLQHESEIEWMGHAPSPEACLAILKKLQPHIILVDVDLPGEMGIALIRQIRRRYPNLQIIVRSAFGQKNFIQKLLESEASGYVLKHASKEELIKAINTVARGDIFLSREVALALNQGKPAPPIPVLTRREKEVLVLIAEGLTNAEIAGKLFVSTSTVDTHRKHLLLKFEARNTASLIRLATKAEVI